MYAQQHNYIIYICGKFNLPQMHREQNCRNNNDRHFSFKKVNKVPFYTRRLYWTFSQPPTRIV